MYTQTRGNTRDKMATTASLMFVGGVLIPHVHFHLPQRPGAVLIHLPQDLKICLSWLRGEGPRVTIQPIRDPGMTPTSKLPWLSIQVLHGCKPRLANLASLEKIYYPGSIPLITNITSPNIISHYP